MFDRNETEACLRILVAVAMADGTFTSDEERALGILASVEGASPRDAPRTIDVAKEAARVRSKEARRAVFEAAVAMSEVDGACHPNEHALLVDLGRALGIEDAPKLAVKEEKVWHDELAASRERLAEVEARFLKQIGSEGELSQAAYEALVRELREARQEILREGLGGAIVH